MFDAMKRLINKQFYETLEIAQEKLDVFYATNRLNKDQYTELTALANSVYKVPEEEEVES